MLLTAVSQSVRWVVVDARAGRGGAVEVLYQGEQVMRGAVHISI